MKQKLIVLGCRVILLKNKILDNLGNVVFAQEYCNQTLLTTQSVNYQYLLHS